MAGSLADRATSDMLIGPDWAMNVEICDILNHDPGQAKDVVKVLKRRIRNKNPKVQLLALTLLETLIKNCGDIVHMHVAEKGVLHQMVKIVRKKRPEHHVKEKILTLIDTWQEVFGGPRARYPQYHAAYQELLRYGVIFPQRPERSAAVLTPPQTQPLTYPQSQHTADPHREATESSAGTDLPNLSLTEIQNARGIMDVLSEMLNALDPGNKEGLRQEVIVDLVEQCRTYKLRVVQLLNTTSDEELLVEGLALNDDLQRVLAKHDAIASGTAVKVENVKSLQALVDVDDAIVTTQNDTQLDHRSASSVTTGNQTSLQQPLVTAAKDDPLIDLLSGEDFNTPKPEDALAIVPISETTTSPSPHQNNILALPDMFSQNNSATGSVSSQPVYLATPTNPSTSPFQLQQQPHEAAFYANGSIPSAGQPQYEQTPYMQDAQNGGAFPPPPWEAQQTQSSEHLQPMASDQSAIVPIHTMQSDQVTSMPPQPMQSGQLVPVHPQQMQSGGIYPQLTQSGQLGLMYSQPIQSNTGMYPQQMQAGQPADIYPQQMQAGQPADMYPQQMQAGQLTTIYPHPMQGSQYAVMYPQSMQYGQQMGMYPQPIQSSQPAVYGYGTYGQQVGSQFLEQRIHGLSMQEDSRYSDASYQTSSPTYLQPKKPARPEDKLFGDLVNIAKTKSNKPDANKVGSL